MYIFVKMIENIIPSVERIVAPTAEGTNAFWADSPKGSAKLNRGLKIPLFTVVIGSR